MSTEYWTVVYRARRSGNVNGVLVPDGPQAWMDAMDADGPYYTAGIGEDSITLQDLQPGGGATRFYVGTATTGAVAAYKLFDPADFLDGEEAALDPVAAAFLRAQQRGDGSRLVPTLRLNSEPAADISFVSPHVIAGHDRIEAALPAGISRSEVFLDDE